MKVVLILLCVLAACVHAPPSPPTQEVLHRFDNPEEWAPKFEDPSRDAWQKPTEVIAALKLEPNDRVADLGSATGYFSVRIARAQPLSKVYGVDVEPKMTEYLAERATNEGLQNLKAITGTAADPQLPEKVDVVLVVDTFHHLDNKVAYFENLKRHLAVDGKIAIIDFKSDSPMGPPPEHRIAAADLEATMKKAGWVKSEELDFLPYQHFFIFTPVR